ncbi:MAG: sugar phosphate nucleotidyltransferase [Eubacteriales bacterium]|jgi:NDP-sugar pyrophosphorylase family protein
MEQTKQPVLVIMAAGMGSRYGGLKQMDPMDDRGHLLIDYSIYDAVQAGFKDIVFVIREENRQDFDERIVDRIRDKVNVKYAYQKLENIPEGFSVPEGRKKPWGTGHALMSAMEAVNGCPFAVINSDDYYGREAFTQIYHFLSETSDDGDMYHYGMVGYLLKNTVTDNGYVSRGVCEVSETGYLKGVTERTRIEKRPGGIAYTEDDGQSWNLLGDDTIVSMNLWGFSNSFMRELAAGFPDFLKKGLADNPLKCEYYIPSVVQGLLDGRKADVRVMTTPDKWYGVTYKEDKPDVVAALKKMREKGIYPEELLG